MEPARRNIKETSSLSQSRKGPQTCYGATRNPENPADYKLVTHTLTLSDTLQGLAIKYGVTIEQIRRVNKLWSNDNIHIFKTINIPVKLTYYDDTLISNDENSRTSRDTRTNRTQECDSEESVDSGVHEVNHDKISIDVEGHSSIISDLSRTKKDALSNSGDSLNSFLQRLDVEMKASIQKAKKQRTKNVPALISKIEATHERERSKQQKQTDSNHVRLKNTRVSLNKSLPSSQSDSGSLDNLFEL